MAQTVGYYEDNNDRMYSEGPYVLTARPGGKGFRIEKQGEGSPMLPPLWVYAMRDLRGIPSGWQSFHVLEGFVDDLNRAHSYITEREFFANPAK